MLKMTFQGLNWDREGSQKRRMLVLAGPCKIKLVDFSKIPVEVVKPSACARRKQRESAAGDGWSEAEWNSLVVKYDGCCLRCGCDDKPLVPDHVIPLCKGGGHAISNIQPLCYLCNIWKGIRIVDFRPSPA